jgi:amidase
VAHDLTSFSATHLASLIRAREVSSVEVVRAHLDRIESVNPTLRAVVQLRAEAALDDARRADASLRVDQDAGPLHGVPFTVKDWIETHDLPCLGELREPRESLPKRDATAVARLRGAGAILLGKTKPGLDGTVYPAPRNPFDPERTPGASSGGEAAIIAAGGSPLGLGSDSGGSLRWPAHCCGIATIKPTNGLVPLTGHFPRIIAMSDPRTVIGPMARTVEDLELALRLIAGPDGRDPSAVPVPLGEPSAVNLRGLRVAFYVGMPGARPSEAVRTAVVEACHALESAGAIVEEAAPGRLEESLTITQAYWARPESIRLNAWAPPSPSRLTADQVEESLFMWDRFRRSMLTFFGRYDLIVCPAGAGPAPLASEPVTAEHYLYTLPFSLTGNPVVVVRAGTEDGLPLGVQVVARNWEDATALAAAAEIERALGTFGF